MNEKEKVLDKIKKLLKLQSSAETLGNEGEAYAAANAVHRLLTTYNLSLGDISDETSDGLNIKESDEISYRSPYGSQWKRHLLSSVASNNYCKILIIPAKQHMLVVGQEDNVIVVKNLYNYLVSSFGSLAQRRRAEFEYYLRQERKRFTSQGKNKFLRSYFIGAVAGLQENFNSRKPTPEETGLMVCHTSAIQGYLRNDPFYSGEVFKGKKPNSDLMLKAFEAGEEDGRNISLNRQIQR
ncbi:DUF7168 domain-containing protein [Porphyromonas levii]|uniref:DUF7168 domain-containing protein n=1 Tax=Porphyromonas levii TaxID=28114 RepID=UPI000364E9D8|nr:DUF2786 domain-containing protein [Porphyromonas levii]